MSRSQEQLGTGGTQPPVAAAPPTLSGAPALPGVTALPGGSGGETPLVARHAPRGGQSVAFLSSLVAHVTLLLVLACWVFTVGKPSRGVLLEANIDDATATALDSLQAFELTSPETTEDVVELDLQEVSIDLEVSLPKLDLADDRAEQLIRDIGASATLTSSSVDTIVRQLRQGSTGKGANFFGAYAEGSRFVYVLDSSTSMTGDRWTYACNQLLDSLKGLEPGQEFFVICFDVETNFLFGKRPERRNFVRVEEDAESIGRVRNWLRSRILGPNTMPAQALKFALGMNPDAIFLLSDGELKDNSRLMLRSINHLSVDYPPIPIHTIHLFSRHGRETLRAIARENNGTFTPIEEQTGFRTAPAR